MEVKNKMNTHKDKGVGKTSKLFKRIIDLEFQLKSEYPEMFTEQKHCSSSYPSERAYWHYGYLMALKDIIKSFQLKEIKP